MRYICTKRAKFDSISGPVNIPYGKSLDLVGEMLYYRGKPVCYRTAQNARDYFSRDNDNKGKKRGALVHEIMDILAVPGEGRQPRWDKIWDDEYLDKFRSKQFLDYWIWNIDFYEADIKDLEYILNKIKD